MIEAVVIGGSAGGVEALSLVLPGIPAASPASFTVVLHLPRDRPSLLVEVFARKCSAAVREAEDKEPVAPGTIYFAPTDYHLLIDDGPQLALSADDPVHHSRPSIDVLFESAAQVYGPRLLGIILTGANEDGAAGLAAIHRSGGVTVVQEPATAHSPQMVMAALKAVPSSRVLSLEHIALLLQSPRQAAAWRSEQLG